MIVDKNNPLPVYYQVREDIRNKIKNGIWKVGQCIDSENELSEKYGVSRMTVRQALGELVQQGILIRERGKGTFVCEPKVKQRDIMSFSEMAEKSNVSLVTRVISFDKVKPSKDLKELLPFDEIYKIDRLRIVDGEVIASEKVFIPCDYCGYLDINMLEGSFYKILKQYGYNLDHSEASVQSVLMDEKYRSIFDVDLQIPLLKSVSKNFIDNDKLLFIEESVYRSDKYILEINIYRKEGKIK